MKKTTKRIVSVICALMLAVLTAVPVFAETRPLETVLAEDLEITDGILYELADEATDTDKDGYIEAEAGFPEFNEITDDKSELPPVTELDIENGTYEGNVYNGTGFGETFGTALRVVIKDDGVLEGDISLTAAVRGAWLNGKTAKDILKGMDPETEYACLDAFGFVTDKEEDACAVQFTKWHVKDEPGIIHSICDNENASMPVVVEGTWKPQSVSLITYLSVEEGGHVYGEVTELEDGNLLIVPAETELEPGTYGKE